MKNAHRLHLVAAIAGAFLCAQAATADTILKRSYSFEKLDALWKSTLEQQPPSARWFAPLGTAGSGPEPMVDVPAGFVPGTSPVGVVIGVVGPDIANVERRGFPVIGIPQDDAPILYQRLALLEIYLGRYRFFEGKSSDGAATLDLLRRRQASATTELYLINLMLYFSEPTLAGKCRKLERLNEVAATALDGTAETALEPAWRPLLPVLTGARSRLDTDAVREIVCAVKPVRGRGEMQKTVTTLVQASLTTEVGEKVDETKSLLSEASTKFGELLADMNIEIKDALKLERELGNVQSNLALVKEDKLAAADTIAKIQAIDLTQLKRPDQLAELAKAKGALKNVIAEIDGVLEATAQLATVSNNGAVGQELKVCETLGEAYDSLDLAQDMASLEAGVMTPYTTCLTKMREVVQRFQAPSLDKAFAAELSRNVKQISDAFLAGGN